MTVNEVVRIIAPEFAVISDDTIDMWIELAKPFVSKKQFHKFYSQALAYMTAHMMKMSGNGENEYGTIADMIRLSSVSEGNTSISFNTGALNAQNVDGDLNLTPYGVNFVRLRKICAVPISCNGVQNG